MDNKSYDITGIIEESLPELLKGNAWGLPMYKYLKDYTKPIFEKVKENFNKNISVDSFLNANLTKQKSNYRKLIEIKIPPRYIT